MTATDVFEESLLPLALVKEEPLEHNISTFAAYCRDHSLELAPHVKTTMSRDIFGPQKGAGAWAPTVATVSQAQHVIAWGAERILIAAQIVDPAGLRWLAEAGREGMAIYSWVDSVEGLRLIETGAIGGSGLKSDSAAGRAWPRRWSVRVPQQERGSDLGRGGGRQRRDQSLRSRRIRRNDRWRACRDRRG